MKLEKLPETGKCAIVHPDSTEKVFAWLDEREQDYVFSIYAPIGQVFILDLDKFYNYQAEKLNDRYGYPAGD